MKRSGKQTFCCGAPAAAPHVDGRSVAGPINEERGSRGDGNRRGDAGGLPARFCTVMLDDGRSRALGLPNAAFADVATLLARIARGVRKGPRCRGPSRVFALVLRFDPGERVDAAHERAT